MEHFPESSIGEIAYAWCNRCGRQTEHEIVRHTEHAGRIGPCLEHRSQELTKKQIEFRKRQKQGSLFESGDARYEFEERAAIKEFCGNLPREVAERQAMEERRKKP